MNTSELEERKKEAADPAKELKEEIERYRALSCRYEKQARRRGVFALIFCAVSLLGILAIVTISILALNGVFGVRWFLLLAYVGLCLFCLLTGLFFFNARHDSRDVSLECLELADQAKIKLKKLLEEQKLEEEKAKQSAVRVVAVLPKAPMSKAHLAANALRATSAILSILCTLAIPVASIAVACKSKPKKKKEK